MDRRKTKYPRGRILRSRPFRTVVGLSGAKLLVSLGVKKGLYWAARWDLLIGRRQKQVRYSIGNFRGGIG